MNEVYFRQLGPYNTEQTNRQTHAHKSPVPGKCISTTASKTEQAIQRSGSWLCAYNKRQAKENGRKYANILPNVLRWSLLVK